MDKNSIDLNALSLEIDERIRAAWERDRRERWEPRSHYASRAGHPCRFYLWAVIAKWDQLPTPDTDLLGIFRSGNEAEESVFRDLRDAGFEIKKQQIGFEDRDLNLRGHVDGFLRLPGHEILDTPRPIEIKSMNPIIFQQVHSFHDMLDASNPWLRKYPGQVLLYGYLSNNDLVGMILRDKSSRQTRTIWAWVDDWWPLLEDIGANLQAVNRHLDEGTEPEPIKYNPALCDKCECAALCPTMLNLRGSGSIRSVDNDQIDELLTIMRDNKSATKIYSDAEKRLKDLLERCGAWNGEIGATNTIVTSKFRVTCSVGRTTRKEIPPDVEPIIRVIPTKKFDWVSL